MVRTMTPMHQFTIPVRVTVFQENDRYVWTASNGESSDYLFDSITEAGEDAQTHFGG